MTCDQGNIQYPRGDPADPRDPGETRGPRQTGPEEKKTDPTRPPQVVTPENATAYGDH